jgi:hypothetical protein
MLFNPTVIRFLPAVLVGLCVLHSRPAEAQTTDLTENNASQWTSFASDGAARTLSNDTTRVKAGASSLRLVTASGFDTGVRYPATGTLNWDLNAAGLNFLFFWVYAENTTPNGWQGNQPVILLRSSGGTYTYTPSSQLTPNFAWKLIKVPLAGDATWVRTSTGTPTLSDIDVIEIHQDTWDAGFTVWYDDVRFANFTPGGLPQAGPPPPPGVDPDAIAPKVLLYIYNPTMTNLGGQRMNQAYGWGDPVALTNQVVQDLQTSSYGRARYQIVETVDDATFPYLEGGFQYTPTSFSAAWAAGNLQSGTFDYARFVSEHGIGPRVDAGEIDEVWVYTFPGAGMYESAMFGRGAYWINGGAYPNAGGNRACVVMGWNFERGVAEAIHSYGHRSESILAGKIYGQWCQNTRCNTWSRFALIDQSAPGLGGVGNVHFPVNGTADYDYANTRYVLSNADAWLNYPNLTDATRSFNFREWSHVVTDPQRQYLNWWYRHMPHVPSKGPDQYLANWWRYLCDVDQFKSGGANLSYSTGQPFVTLTAPAPDASIPAGTIVQARASAEADGALGRVDLYVDGAYLATDSLSPFTFTWNTAGYSGRHTLVAKAYELQNGTEAVGLPVSVTITPACDANFDGVNGLGVSDIFAFLNAWFALDPRADFNHVNGVTVQDIFDFLNAWFAGC